jgi:hypothetical protein
VEVDVGLYQHSSLDCLRPSILLPGITALVHGEGQVRQGFPSTLPPTQAQYTSCA